MSTAWTGDWKDRIETFARREGYDGIWEYLCAHPGIPLVNVARTIGNAAAIQIRNMVVEHCLDERLVGDCLCDLMVRRIHEHLPSGWGSKDDFAHALALSGIGRFPDPYSKISDAMASDLLRTSPPPQGWLPASKDDPTLRDAYDRARKSLPDADRKMILRGEFVLPPGTAYWRAIEPIWKSISIHEDPQTFLQQFGDVRMEFGHLYAAHWCQSEVCNGGFHQFFMNSTGILAPEAAAGFGAIGMLKCARLVAEAMEFFDFPFPREREMRVIQLQAVQGESRAEWDPFTELDDRFFKLLENENGGFLRSADAYAQENQ